MQLIAKESMFGCRPGGEPFEISIEIEAPSESPDYQHEWVCRVRLTPFLSKSRDVRGDSSLQALCLALSYVRKTLGCVLEEGSRLTYASGEDFPLDAVFGTTQWQ